MKIIVVGCGKVGYNLAEQLAAENHDVTVIDSNEVKLETASTNLDIIGVPGNGTSFHVQEEAGVKEADLLIAVTDRDEINLLSCLIAKKAGNCQTIARVRNPEYYNEIGFLKEELGLAMVINPELAAAAEISRLIQVPSAMEIDTFAKGRINLVKFEVPKDSSWAGMKISEISSKFSGTMLICIIERKTQGKEAEVIIPHGNITLEPGDKISVIVPPEHMNSFFRKMGVSHKVIKNVMIAGGSRIAYYLAERLTKSGIKVKIVEKSRSRCEELSSALPKVMVIDGDAANDTLLTEEGIENMDAFVALTNFDEENIMLSLYANKMSNAKLFTKINRVAFEGVVNEIPIGSIITPKNLTAEYIIQYVRSMQNSIGSNVEAVYRMVHNQVEALEFYVKEDSAVTNRTFAELKLKPNLLVCGIVRNGVRIIPSGQDMILKGDSVIVVTTNIGLNDIQEIMA